MAGWQVGQQIAIVTTTFFDITTNQNEVRTITAVNGNTVSFSQPLQFAHYGWVACCCLLFHTVAPLFPGVQNIKLRLAC